MKVRINSYSGKFYPEVKRKSEWDVLRMETGGYYSTGWKFSNLPFAVRNGYCFETQAEALDLLESYLGAGTSVIACDIIKRRWWHKWL